MAGFQNPRFDTAKGFEERRGFLVERVLVTGGAGYVGSACCEQLLANGHKVIILDDLSASDINHVLPGCSFYQEDIGNRTAVAKILRSEKISTVFHFAAKALIPESV